MCSDPDVHPHTKKAGTPSQTTATILLPLSLAQVNIHSGLLVPSLQIVSAISGASKFEFTCGAGEGDDDDDDVPSVLWCDGEYFVVASDHRLELFQLNQKTPLLSWRNPIPDEKIKFCSFDGVSLVCCGYCNRFILNFMPGQLAVWPE